MIICRVFWNQFSPLLPCECWGEMLIPAIHHIGRILEVIVFDTFMSYSTYHNYGLWNRIVPPPPLLSLHWANTSVGWGLVSLICNMFVSQVKKMLAQTIIAMAHHGYLELEGGQEMISFIIKQCSLAHDPPVSNINKCGLTHVWVHVLACTQFGFRL